MASRSATSLALSGLVVLTAFGTFLADQATKARVRAALPPGATRPGLGSWARLRRVENRGVAFGLLAGQPRLAAVVASLASLALAALATRVRSHLGALALGLVIGGWAGNGLDRLRRGSVTDFLDLGVGPVRWPAFNLADAAISGGALLLARALSRE